MSTQMNKCTTIDLSYRNTHELKVLENELHSLKKDARVFLKQRNSNVLFLADKQLVSQAVKKQLELHKS